MQQDSNNTSDNIDETVTSAFNNAEQGTLELVDLMSVSQRLSALGRGDKAIALYRLWLEQSASPLAYVACFNLGVALAADSQYSEAEQMYRKALEQNPSLIQARLNLGNSLEQQGRKDEALDQWRMALKVKSITTTENRPLQLHALNNLGRLLEIERNFKESLAMLEKSFSIDPTQQDVLLHLVHLRQKICDWPVYKPPKGITKEEMIKGTSPLAMVAALDDPALQLSVAKKFVDYKYTTSMETLAPKGGYKHEKIRVGYLSSDFCLHAVSLLTVQLYELHNREQFEVYGFCWSREDGTALRNRVIKAMDHYIRVEGMSDRETAECIQSNEIDILIDLQGLTSGARPQILSYRPAPVQITYLGFTGTTALPWIDYVIADKYLIPDELAPFFMEKPLYMSNCFQVSDCKREMGAKPTRSENNLPEDAFVYCSFNNNYKFTPDLFAIWMSILKHVPNSVLWLLADNEWARENMCKAAKKHGVKSDRLIFATRAAPPNYLARYQIADLFLDTFPFNGGTTANDALYMGLPLLTCSGKTFASRMAGSLLLNLGLPELIANNFKEYEEKAIELGKKGGGIDNVKKKLSENIKTSAVFDMPRVVRDLERLLVKALKNSQNHLENAKPLECITVEEVQETPQVNQDSLDVIKSMQGQAVFTRDLAQESKIDDKRIGVMTLPKLPGISPTVIKNFYDNTNWGVSDPEKFAYHMGEAAKLVTPGYYFGDNLFTWGRNNSLFEDPAFLVSWQRNALNSADQAIAWRRYILACAAYHCIQLDGDFVECGVYQGSGMKTVIDYIGVTEFKRTFWGYDTFDYHPVAGHAFQGQTEGLFESIQKRFEGYDQVRLVRGLLPASLDQNSPDKISYLHLDLNSAEYEIAVLDSLFDRVVAGGMVILDDYEWAGIYRVQKIAEDAWFEKRNYRVFPLPTGQGFVIKR